MQWVVDNWIWLLLGGGMIAMHLFGHGSHGGHGKGGHGGHGKGGKGAPPTESDSRPDSPAVGDRTEKHRDP